MVGWLVFTGIAAAGCGLDLCAPPPPPGPALTARIGVETGAWSERASRGQWGVGRLGLGAVPLQPLALSLTLPIDLQTVDGTTLGGLGNPTLGADAAAVGGVVRPVGGLQVELPLGTGGVADRHWTLLPSAGARLVGGRLWAEARVGARWVPDAHPAPTGGRPSAARIPEPDHVDAPTTDPATQATGAPLSLRSAPRIIDPHADREWVVRGAVGLGQGLERVQPRLTVDGVRVAGDGGGTLVDLGGAVGLRWTDTLGAELHARAPVTAARRFDWRAGAAITGRWSR